MDKSFSLLTVLPTSFVPLDMMNVEDVLAFCQALRGQVSGQVFLSGGGVYHCHDKWCYKRRVTVVYGTSLSLC